MWLSIDSKFKIESTGMIFKWSVWQVEMETQKVSSDMKSIKHDDYFVKEKKKDWFS